MLARLDAGGPPEAPRAGGSDIDSPRGGETAEPRGASPKRDPRDGCPTGSHRAHCLRRLESCRHERTGQRGQVLAPSAAWSGSASRSRQARRWSSCLMRVQESSPRRYPGSSSGSTGAMSPARRRHPASVSDWRFAGRSSRGRAGKSRWIVPPAVGRPSGFDCRWPPDLGGVAPHSEFLQVSSGSLVSCLATH